MLRALCEETRHTLSASSSDNDAAKQRQTSPVFQRAIQQLLSSEVEVGSETAPNSCLDATPTDCCWVLGAGMHQRPRQSTPTQSCRCCGRQGRLIQHSSTALLRYRCCPLLASKWHQQTRKHTWPAALLPCRCPHMAASCQPASRSSSAALKQSPVPSQACSRCSSRGLDACWQEAVQHCLAAGSCCR
jgi:hypothetical protein